MEHHQSMKQLSVFLVVAFVLVATAYLSLRNTQENDARSLINQNPLKEIFLRSETEYDFGIVKQSGGIVKHDFSFQYQGEVPLEIVGVPTSCSCTQATADKKKINPGDLGVVTVSFDPNLHEEPQGKFFKTITLRTEPPLIEPLEWKIWAEIDLDLGPEAYKLKTHRDE